MPCFITGSAAGDAQLAADEARAEATKVTRMLCAAMKELEHYEMLHLVREVPDLNAWWVEHKRIDAERKRQEAKRKKARGIERRVEAYRRALEEE
jgi:2-oxo-4-hydroxy-4-carboxy--5-ureidoimidazoline (OHCU) decarboxylase